MEKYPKCLICNSEPRKVPIFHDNADTIRVTRFMCPSCKYVLENENAWIENNTPKDRPVNLFDGDKRCEALLGAVMETIYERGVGISIPAILGVLDLAKDTIKNDH